MNQEEMDPKAEEQTTPETMESNVTESVATDTANVETEAIQIEEVKPEETTSTEVATDSAKESVKTIEAEEDHEEPKEQKLSIPDFDQLSIEDSLAVIKSHINEFTPVRIKGIVENGRSAILHELNKEQASVKEVYLAEGGNIIDFHFEQPLRKELGIIYGTYRDGLRNYYAELEAQLVKNLTIKEHIVEEIKALPLMNGSAKEKYDAFKGLREKWNNTGLVPKADARTIWANYNHHVDSFFNFLRLAYDLIDKDYQNNLNEKIALIEELEAHSTGAINPELFRLLQKSHSRWKRIGPVPREQKEQVWDRLKAVTAVIHEKRDTYNETLKELNVLKIQAKRNVVDQITALNQSTPSKHSGWQKASKALEVLRGEFKTIGFVKSQENDLVWEDYKVAQREFNRLKNVFYKEEKAVQRENLSKKEALVALAQSLKDNDNFAETASALKKAQADWKISGYVPKKEGDRLWELFRSACNDFFDKMNGERKAKSENFSAAIKVKEEKLTEIKTREITSVEEAVGLSEEWSELGAGNRKLDAAFDKMLEEKLKGLGLSKEDLESTLFTAKVKALVEADNQEGLLYQRNWLRDQMEHTKKELNQLENNLLFFSNSKGNPLLEAAEANIHAQKTRVAHLTSLRKRFNSLLK